MRSLNYIKDENVLYSWPSILGFCIMIGILIWSYTNHITTLVYSTSAIFLVCVTMIQIYAPMKKGYNALSFFVILWPCVFLTIAFTLAYFIYKNIKING